MSVLLLQGDARELPLAEKSVQTVVTSPPYFGLRDYGVPPAVWDADPTCAHEWGDPLDVNATNHTDKRRWQHTRNGRDEFQPTEKRVAWLRTPVAQGQFCHKCGAWFGCLGLEPTLAMFIKHVVEIFREVRRVLRDDGTVWCNMGDGYNAHPGQRKTTDKVGAKQETNAGACSIGSRNDQIFKPKDLLMQPHRLAIALQDDGWYIRSDIVWAKPNPMPESVTDRPTKSHEYIFLLSKSQRYYFDQEAVREPATEPRRAGKNSRANVDRVSRENLKQNAIALRRYVGFNQRYDFENPPSGRNLRSVWTIATQALKAAHFATFPLEIPRRCIKAGTSEKGRCPHCGAAWKRIVERVNPIPHDGSTDCAYEKGSTANRLSMLRQAARARGEEFSRQTRTTHWLPQCKCPTHSPIPCVVLDPFGGAATTALAASELGRHCVIVERKWDYLLIGKDRLANHRPKSAKRPRRVREAKPEPQLWPELKLEVPA